ncbi:MAG: TonB-dependent receptor [Acidobacteriaceae bacterium]|nr:TonB-dependent receptor [Acidobacteriaceae bacterium]
MLSASLLAQTTFATLTGTLTDPTGAAVPGASVVAIRVANNFRYATQTNAAGTFTLGQLQEGAYTVRLQAPGFKEFVAQQLELVAMDVRRLDVQLQVGAVETSVEVTAGGTLIETETARISDSKSARQINTLPLNTRSLWNFVGLSPGVVQAGGGSSTRRFSGSRANQSDASIDGITLSNQFDGTQISPLVSQVESFEEVRVDMANNTAEFGGIGQVTIVSKSGTNELHGSAFDYYATPWFRARNPFAAQRGTGVRHNPGFSLGGPIFIPKLYDGRNRSFFYQSFETTRGSLILSNRNSTVPLAPWRAGNFAGETAIRDPFAANAPFAGNLIPAARLNPVSRKIQDRFYPLPNFGDATRFVANNHRIQSQRPFDPNTFVSTRLDHRFNDKHFVFGRYIWNRSHSRDFDSPLPAIGQRWQTRDTRAVNLSHTFTIKSNLLLESRWGYAWNDNPRHGPLMGLEVVRDLGLTGLMPGLPDVNGLFQVSFNTLNVTGISQTQWRHPGFLNFAQQFQEHLSWFRGRHNLKAGFIAGRTLYEDWQMPTNLFGAATFSNRFTGQAYADFLLGLPTSSSRAAAPLLTNRVRWNYDFFITDEWKIRQNLTLNLGLRYELHPSWSEGQGQQALFDVTSGKVVVPDGSLGKVSPLLPRGYVDVVEASTLGFHPKYLLTNDVNNFAPRIGIAWRPLGPNTVIRTGLGIFYDIIPRTTSAGGAPFVINEPTYTNAQPIPDVVLPRVFPASVAGPASITLPGAVRRDLRIPYSMQYNFTLEHQRWSTGFRASYIGTNTRQGEWGYNINQPLPGPGLFVDKPRPFPRYPNINYQSNGAGHQYNSLTLEAERRFARGLGYQLSWVWARDIGDLERGESPENAYDRQRERSVWLDIPRHRITGNLIYELPFAKSARGLKGALLKGWEWNSVYSFFSGEFLTPQWTGTDPTGTAFTNNRTPAQVTIRPNHLRNANLPTSQRSTGRWFDIGAFGPPTPGFFGSAAKGVIMGPGSAVVNAGLAKQFTIAERLRVRWEMTATNFFNSTNLNNPNTNITDVGGAGVITGAGGEQDLDAAGPRNFRMGLRLEW